VIKQWYHRLILRDCFFVPHVITSIATKRSSHLLHLPRTGSYPRTSVHNQGTIIIHGTKKSLPPLRYTCTCQPYRRQLRVSTQPQEQTAVTLTPTTGKKILHHKTKHQPRPTAPHWHEPTRHVHYIVIHKQDNTCYMHGSLPSAHTPTHFV